MRPRQPATTRSAHPVHPAHPVRRRRPAGPVHALAALLVAASLALAGCSASGGDSGDSSAASDGKAAADGPARGAEYGSGGAKGSGSDSSSDSRSGAAAEAPKLTATSIIRTASLTVQVKDVPKALDAARTTTEDAGGYVGDESTTRDADGHERTRVVLRVPTERYDEVLGDLQGGGRLLDRTAKAQDVTDQVVDVDSRVKSARASVARVRELMDRATKLSDVVALEGELSSRQADLEALLAQQASLKDRVGLATITLSLTETPVKKAAKDETPGFTDALAGGWHVFLTMLRWIALAIGALLPFAAVAATAAAVWLRVVRPRRQDRRRQERPAAMTAGGPAPAQGTLPQYGEASDD